MIYCIWKIKIKRGKKTSIKEKDKDIVVGILNVSLGIMSIFWSHCNWSISHFIFNFNSIFVITNSQSKDIFQLLKHNNTLLALILMESTIHNSTFMRLTPYLFVCFLYSLFLFVFPTFYFLLGVEWLDKIRHGLTLNKFILGGIE